MPLPSAEDTIISRWSAPEIEVPLSPTAAWPAEAALSRMRSCPPMSVKLFVAEGTMFQHLQLLAPRALVELSGGSALLR